MCVARSEGSCEFNQIVQSRLTLICMKNKICGKQVIGTVNECLMFQFDGTDCTVSARDSSSRDTSSKRGIHLIVALRL